MKRYRVFLSGDVQGVGMRISVYRLAKQLQLTGWVCNEPDGRVSLEVQGDARSLLRFWEALPVCARWAQIDHMDRWEIPVQNEETAFLIRG